MSFIAFEILLLDQDLQDFEDFLAVVLSLDGARSSQLFGSGFTGFFSIGP
jgi:hypothetical protein